MAKRNEMIIAVIALIVSVVAAGFTGWQAIEARKTRIETKELSTKTLKVSQRSYLGVEPGYFKRSDHPEMSFSVHAGGSTPALGVSVGGVCTGAENFDESKVRDVVANYAGTYLMLPGNVSEFKCGIQDSKIDKRNNVFLFGTIIYHDVFGEEHKTDYCFEAFGGADSFDRCVGHNTAN